MNDVNSGLGALAVRLLAGVSIMALGMAASPAYAQDIAAPAPAAEDEPTQAEEASETDQTIDVTARLTALDNAIDINRNADTIDDSETADEAGQLPDHTIS